MEALLGTLGLAVPSYWSPSRRRRETSRYAHQHPFDGEERTVLRNYEDHRQLREARRPAPVGPARNGVPQPPGTTPNPPLDPRSCLPRRGNERMARKARASRPRLQRKAGRSPEHLPEDPSRNTTPSTWPHLDALNLPAGAHVPASPDRGSCDAVRNPPRHRLTSRRAKAACREAHVPPCLEMLACRTSVGSLTLSVHARQPVAKKLNAHEVPHPRLPRSVRGRVHGMAAPFPES
jgi:hypothetical protein